MNDTNIKPSKEVFGNELLLVRKNQINYQYKVLDLPESRVVPKLWTCIEKMSPQKRLSRKTKCLNLRKTTIEKKELEDPPKKIEGISKIIQMKT